MQVREGTAAEEIPLEIMQVRRITAAEEAHVEQYVMLTCSVRGILSIRKLDIIAATLTHQGML